MLAFVKDRICSKNPKCRLDFDLDIEDDYASTLVFAAGTALAALCLKRAILVVFLVKQWHLWVFLLLNALLLVIFFTSTHTIKINQEPNPEGGKFLQKQGKPKSQDSGLPATVYSATAEKTNLANPDVAGRGDGDWVEKDEQEEEDEEEEAAGEGGGVYCELSDEELNERVEAFIATFRRHLVIDARRR